MKQRTILFFSIFFLLTSVPAISGIVVDSPKLAENDKRLFNIGLDNALTIQTMTSLDTNFELTSLLNLVSQDQLLLAKKYVNESTLPQDLKYYFIGLINMSKGDLEAAKKSFTLVSEIKPDSIYANYALAATEYATGNSVQSLILIKQYNDTSAASSLSLMFQAKIESSMGRMEEMELSLRKAIGVASGNIAPTRTLVKYLFRQERSEDAEILLKKFINDNPLSKDGHALAVSYYLSTKRIASAHTALDKWIIQHPKDPIPRMQLIESLLSQQEYDTAEGVIDRAVYTFPEENEFLYLKAKHLRLLGDFKAAKRILNTITTNNSDFVSKERAKKLLLGM